MNSVVQKGAPLIWQIVGKDNSVIALELPLTEDPNINQVLEKIVSKSREQYREIFQRATYYHCGLKRLLSLADLQANSSIAFSQSPSPF